MKINITKIKDLSIESILKSKAKTKKTRNNKIIINKKNLTNKKLLEEMDKQEKIDYNKLNYFEAIKIDKRNIFNMFFSLFMMKIKTIDILFFRDEYSYFSLSFSFYLFEILIDITINSLLFSDDIISQKYFNNGELLLITTNLLSIISNIISFIILFFTEKLINQNLIFEKINKEIKSNVNYLRLFIKISRFLQLKIIIFYFILFNIGLFCTYYLFVFCATYKKIQKNLLTNYIVGSLWSFGLTAFICLVVAITRKIAIIGQIKKLFIISKYIDDMF